jgi:hypothetical protein
MLSLCCGKKAVDHFTELPTRGFSGQIFENSIDKRPVLIYF